LVVTLDAGANVHLLYPKLESKRILKFIEEELVGFCVNGQYICDEVGSGPALLNEDYA
jgi:diphosphomevalonate decarboxylase